MEKAVIRGYIDHIIYQNEANGYTVMIVNDDKTETTVTGIFKGIETGEKIHVEGHYQSHPSYGEQLQMEAYEILPLDDLKSMERYLGSGAIKGVGEALAKRIVKRFGNDTFQIIENEPERLIEIKGISERIAREIATQMYDKKQLRQAMIFLQDYGISDKLAIKIYEKYQEQVYMVLKTNPYKLAEDLDGVGFKKADEIAQNVGIIVNSEFRIRSGILYQLSQELAEGNTCVPESVLLKRSVELLTVSKEEVEIQLSNLFVEHKVIFKKENKEQENYIYTPYSFQAENNCAHLLKQLDITFFEAGTNQLSKDESLILDKLIKIQDREGIVLDEMQQNAIMSAIASGVSILTGGPGTGKTTTIHTMLRYFENEDMIITLAAPTGRAAKRMSEATGMEASTIHRLLEVNSSGEGNRSGFMRNETNPIETDVLIIDEMSMVDIFLFQALLKALTQGTRLILVGDVDQLPSVGAGCVLSDVINSKAYQVTVLEKIFRQAAESDIVMNAHRIHAGKNLKIDNANSKDFYVLPRDSVDIIYNNIVQLITGRLPRYVGANPLDIQVLSPMKKGPLGVATLNTILQTYLNPQASDKREYKQGDMLLREGDKVMQIKNNYKLEWEITGKYQLVLESGQGVFNGDIGYVKEINDYAKHIEVIFDEGKKVLYRYEDLAELELAYAITIHKSQGSEYPAVVIPLLNVPPMLMYRNLLYTAVTRAKKCVTLIGSQNIVDQMIMGENKQKRFTGLKYRILELERMHGKEFS